MPRHSSTLLDRLKALPPNHIYALAPKESILRGYDYYSRERLESYRWNSDHTVLTAMVTGTKRYTVQVSTYQDALRYSCTCPAWTAATHCKHVICTLLTTMNALMPGTFTLPGDHSQRRRTLQTSLLGSPHDSVPPSSVEPAQDLAIVLTPNESGLSITIERNGAPCHVFYGIPTELALLMRSEQDPAWLGQAHFLHYLEQYGHAHPLVFQEPDRRTALTWRPSRHYQPVTVLNAADRDVHVHARFVHHDVVQERIHAYHKLVVNLDDHTLSPLQDTQGWNTFYAIQEADASARWRRALETDEPADVGSALPSTPWPSHASAVQTRSTRPLHMTLEAFHALPLSFATHDDALQHTHLAIDGNRTTLQAPTPDHDDATLPAYRISIQREEYFALEARHTSPLCTLKLECLRGTFAQPPHEALFSAFVTVEQARDLSQAFRSQKRKHLLRNTMFHLCTVRTRAEAHRVIQEAVDGPECKNYLVKSEAKRLLRQFYEMFAEPESQLVPPGAAWRLAPIDKARQVLLYAIPYDIFGHEPFRGMLVHDTLMLPQSVLHPKLPDLHAKLQAAGIALRYDEKPVSTSQWEFSFDAQRPPDIDWFEITPDIKCDGVVLDERTWMNALQDGSVMETPDGIRILDVNTVEVLKSLSLIFPSPAAKAPRAGNTELVTVPTLQILDWIALRKRGVHIALSERDEALVQRLLNFETVTPVAIPSGLQTSLRAYQKSGYQWLNFLYEHRFGACLADDMGLGKTLQAISLLSGIHEGIIQPATPIDAPHLVVLPPSLLFNWEHEISRFYPHMTVKTYSGKDREIPTEHCDILLTTYGIVRRDIDLLEQHRFHVIIFDEAQALKNILARSTGAARRLRGYFKLAMTGTPLENHLGEYYSLIDLCVPGLLGDYDTFKSQMKGTRPAMLETLLQRTKPFVLRRTKAQILEDLPEKIETDVYLDLTDRQKALYQETVAQIRPTIDQAYRTKTAAQARIIALTAILKLRQICLSPRLVNPESTDASPKVTCIVDRLHELLDEGHSALVFSQFTSFLDLVEQEFLAHKLPYSRLDGSTPTRKRKTLVQEFQEHPTPSAFLLSLKAGGQGLNLTRASYVFHLDPWWNPAVENQASDRAHRIGQTQKVSIMRLLMHHTIEEKMMQLKEHKLALYRAVMEGSTQRGAGAGITKQDFDFLLE